MYSPPATFSVPTDLEVDKYNSTFENPVSYKATHVVKHRNPCVVVCIVVRPHSLQLRKKRNREYNSAVCVVDRKPITYFHGNHTLRAPSRIGPHAKTHKVLK